LFQGDGEREQQLPGIELVGPRPVVPLLQPQQFHFQSQRLELGLLPLARGLVALACDGRDDRLQGGGIIRQRAEVNVSNIIHDDDRIYALSTEPVESLMLFPPFPDDGIV
jgi:hypothetical protein